MLRQSVHIIVVIIIAILLTMNFTDDNQIIHTTHGSFHISQEIFGAWNEKYVESYAVDYQNKSFILNAQNGRVKVRIEQKDVSYGDVELIQLSACGQTLKPEYAQYVISGKSVLLEINEDDHNVVVNHENPIELSWNIPNNCFIPVILTLKANEYESPEKYAFKFPEVEESVTYTYRNNGSFIMDGKLNEVDGLTEPHFSPFWSAATGHPSNNTHIYIRDDKNYVYISADITLDNTNEFGNDWYKIIVHNTPSGAPVEYRIDDFHKEFGTCSFNITSKVNYRHQTCEARIHKSNILGNKINFTLRYYGTAGGSGSTPTLQSSNYEDPTYDSTPTFTGVAQDDDADITSIAFNVSNLFDNIVCSIDDGVLDETTEAFTCTVPEINQLTIANSYVYNISIDDAGNNGPGFQRYFTFSIDTSAPTITLNALSPDPTSDSTPTFTGTVEDDVGTVTDLEYQIDSTSGSWTDCSSLDGSFDETSESFECTVSTVSAGQHTIYIRSTDSYNNTNAGEDYSDVFTVLAAPTVTPTPQTLTSNAQSTNSAAEPQIPQSTIFDKGGVFSPIADSHTEDHNVFAIIPPRTFAFDAYLYSTISNPSFRGVLPNSMTGILPTAQPRQITYAGNILGIKSGKGIVWQIGKIQNIWYKAYGPGYDIYKSAKIIPELQNKPSIIALSYKDSDLIPPGKPRSRFNAQTLKLAHTIDGITWKILPTSVVDTKNHTVAALHRVGGYYMIVGK